MNFRLIFANIHTLGHTATWTYLRYVKALNQSPGQVPLYFGFPRYEINVSFVKRTFVTSAVNIQDNS